MSKTKPSPKREAQVEKTMHLTYINTLVWGLRLCLFLYSPLPFFGSVLNVSYLLVFNMAREKEEKEVRPRLRESRSVHVLTPHLVRSVPHSHSQAVPGTPALPCTPWVWLQPEQKVLAVDINVKEYQSLALPWVFLPHFPFLIQLLQPPDIPGFKFVPAEPVHNALTCCRHLFSTQSCSLRVCRYKELSILAPINSRKKN